MFRINSGPMRARPCGGSLRTTAASIEIEPLLRASRPHVTAAVSVLNLSLLLLALRAPRPRATFAISVLTFSLLLGGCTGAGGADAAANPAAEWRDLFDGQTLAGWSNPYAWGEAWVENGEIHLRANRKFFLVTDERFDDFVFEGELILPDTISNSGIMFRAQVEPNRVFGYQAEADPKMRRWSGGLYDEDRRGWLNPPAGDDAAAAAFRQGPGTAFRPTDWNHYRIEARGDSLRLWINGTLTTEYADTVDAEGVIGLQHHGEAGKVYRFRNLRIQPLKAGG